jgi:hypothetical protein
MDENHRTPRPPSRRGRWEKAFGQGHPGLNPPYESQRRNEKARSYLQAYRTRQRIGGSRPVVDPVPGRPYRMKRKTYARLCDGIERLERPLVGSRVLRHAPLWIRPLTY